jgi:hypothetical protein
MWKLPCFPTTNELYDEHLTVDCPHYDDYEDGYYGDY